MNANGIVFIALAGAGVLVYFLARVFFLLTVYRCLSRVHPGNRRMQPVMVWLDLIPCFNLVWGFIIVQRLADSLEDEFYDRRLDRPGEDYGRGVGIGWMVCSLLTAVFGALAGVPALILWVLYWSKIAGYSRALAGDGADEYEFDDPPD